MKIDLDLNKTCVITNYRTGSTSFVRDNAQKRKMLNYFELLEQYDIERAELRLIHGPSRFIFKVMPDQFDNDIAQLERLTQWCTEIVYLYRKDFGAQCRSWIAMQHLQDWNVKPQNTQPVHQIVDIDQAFADKHSLTIRSNNDQLTRIHKHLPAPVYAYEDIQDNNPYSRTYDWTYEPYIKPYATEEMFK
jgi:hypothetical protein